MNVDSSFMNTMGGCGVSSYRSERKTVFTVSVRGFDCRLHEHISRLDQHASRSYRSRGNVWGVVDALWLDEALTMVAFFCSEYVT